ncbi:MAG: MoaD/ThiS family protein [Sulfolobales archaeon]
MRVKIELYGFLRNLAGTKDVVIEVPEGSTLRELLFITSSKIPGLREAISPDGQLKPYFMLFINEVDYELLGGYDYVVRDGDSLQLLPISHGGSVKPLEEYLNRVSSMKVFTCLVDESLAKELLNYVDIVNSGCVAQVIPRRYYYGAKYSALVAYLTLRSMKLGLNVSKKKSLEFLLYYFGDRQIGNVLSLIKSWQDEEYVAIHACLTEATETEDIFLRTISSCSNKPAEPERTPEEAVSRLVFGVLRILS